MAYLVKPFTKADLVPAIEMAVSRHEEMVALTAEVSSLSERLETRKLVGRAKGQLMAQHGWTEPQAFRWIQKASMDRRLSMREVAQIVRCRAGRRADALDLRPADADHLIGRDVAASVDDAPNTQRDRVILAAVVVSSPTRPGSPKPKQFVSSDENGVAKARWVVCRQLRQKIAHRVRDLG